MLQFLELSSKKGKIKMLCYKGFDKDLKCQDFQYETGKKYSEESAEICEKGFHACEFPLDVFRYYAPSDSRYCEVDLDANDQKSNDSKRVGKSISIKAEIGIAGIVKAGVEYIKNQVDWNNDKKPTPETVQRQPTPDTVQRQPTPDTVQRQPTPDTVQRQPTPETVQRQPTPETVQRQPTPDTVQRQPTPDTVQRQP
jgi:hypothetical protein